MNSKKSLPNDPWKDWVQRVIIHVPQYLSYDGKKVTAGGRQRTVMDLAELIKKKIGWEVLIVQKGYKNFTTRYNNIKVIGFKVPIGVEGDFLFGMKTKKLVKEKDAILYVGGEDAWPFFVRNSKAYHVGVWWDGPYAKWKKLLNAYRTLSLFTSARSICCCDTNVINWLRAYNKKGFMLSKKAIYIPNYADLSRIPPINKKEPGNPFKILFARRFDIRRGTWLAIEAFSILISKGINAELIMCSPEGQEISINEVENKIKSLNLKDRIFIYTNYNLENIYEIYDKVDVSLVPTIWSEGTSYSCIESLVAGIPIVATNVGGLPNVIIQGFNGFLVSPDPKEIAKSLIELIEKETWQNMHHNCLNMRSCFSKEIWDRRILDWLIS